MDAISTPGDSENLELKNPGCPSAPDASSALVPGGEKSPQMAQQYAEDADGASSGSQVSVGDGCVVYMSNREYLKLENVLQVLENPNPNKMSTMPPTKPAGGSVYVFDSDIAKTARRCDQYSWHHDGAKCLPKADPQVKKFYYYFKNRNGEKDASFRKHEYQLLDTNGDGATLVHYIGDSSIADTSAPHGNSRKSRQPYCRTSSSVKAAISSQGTDAAPMKVYRKLVTSESGRPSSEPVMKPRNLEQVKNFQKVTRRRFRIGHDGLYNCIQLANQFPEYVRYIQVHPDLVIHLVNNSLVSEMEKAFETTTALSTAYPELQYDTTFTLGDFYLSVLSFRHSIFEGKPTIPVAFMVHERKFQKDHRRFMELMKDTAPVLQKRPFCLITDCEFDFRSILSQVTHLYCWNHIKRDVRLWLRRNQACNDDLRIYGDQVTQLLSCKTEEDYHTLLESLSLKWSQGFVSYFHRNLQNRILTHSGRWIVEPTRLFNPYSGVTTNASESMNRVLHELEDWKERPIDALLISLKYMQGFYFREITRGHHGMGNYIVKDAMKEIIQPAEFLPESEKIITPEEIVGFVKKGMISEDANAEEQPAPNSGRVAQRALAQDCAASNKVTFVPEAKAFVVTGSDGKKYAVTLFPKETCQCASTTNCYHIMAAKMVMGIPLPSERRMLNLSVLRKKRLSRSDKTSGRKRPRTCDYEIGSAPDSGKGRAEGFYQPLGDQDGVEFLCESKSIEETFKPPDPDWQQRNMGESRGVCWRQLFCEYIRCLPPRLVCLSAGTTSLSRSSSCKHRCA